MRRRRTTPRRSSAPSCEAAGSGAHRATASIVARGLHARRRASHRAHSPMLAHCPHEHPPNAEPETAADVVPEAADQPIVVGIGHEQHVSGRRVVQLAHVRIADREAAEIHRPRPAGAPPQLSRPPYFATARTTAPRSHPAWRLRWRHRERPIKTPRPDPQGFSRVHRSHIREADGRLNRVDDAGVATTAGPAFRRPYGGRPRPSGSLLPARRTAGSSGWRINHGIRSEAHEYTRRLAVKVQMRNAPSTVGSSARRQRCRWPQARVSAIRTQAEGRGSRTTAVSHG